MDMLLRHVTITDLAAIFRRHSDRSPAPYLRDPKVIRAARQHAQTNGIWQALGEKLNPAKDIPVIKRSTYRNFQREGDRTLPQNRANERLVELNLAVLAAWLGHPKADIDYVQDLLWAYCDDFTWVMAAHEGRLIDLGAAMLSATLAEILYILKDQLEDEVTLRVSREIEQRIFQNFWNYQHLDDWKTVRHNWNHVCNGEVIRTALYQIEDPVVLAHMVHSAIQNMTYAIDGFTEDGGCVEGPGYWDYGFGHFLHVAHALYLRTDGDINLMSDDKIHRICRYPLAANISGPTRSTFADSSHGYTPSRIAMIANEFYPISELYDLCEHHPDGSLVLKDLHELSLYKGQKVSGQPDALDYALPELGLAKLRGVPGPSQLTVMCLAGNNGVNHNHNDIGSFIVYRDGRVYLTDPGGPIYSRKTFSAERYESVFCNAIGHSVPVVNGQLQPQGGQFYGTLSVDNLNGTGQKSVTVDMTHAYPEGTVAKLQRRFVLDGETNRLVLEDDYLFDAVPSGLEEAFITCLQVTVAPDDRSVEIGDDTGTMTLRSLNQAGVFSIKVLTEESKEGRTGELIRRITFVPDALKTEMNLRFTFE